MANEVNVKAVITADDRASSVIAGMGDNVSKTSDKIKSALAAAGAVAITVFGKQSVQAFEESESAMAQLDAVLKSTAGAAGVTRESAVALSKQIEKTTSLSDEASLAVENMGLTFTNIHSDIFPSFIKAAIDTTTALNHGLKPSTEQLTDVTKMLGKAMQDPDGAIMALHRYGINTDQLAPKVKAASTLIEKQRLIVQELGTEFGGSASAQAKTFGGQMDQLKEKFNDLQEQVGSVIVGVLRPLVVVLSDHPALLKAVTDAVLALAVAFVALKAASLISDIITAAGIAIQFVGAASIATTAAVEGLTFATVLAAAPWLVLAAAVGVALVQLDRARNSMLAAVDATNALTTATENAGISQDQAIRKINASNLSPTQKADRIRTLFGTSARAAGGPVTGGMPYLVGERGPEVIIPKQSGTVIPNNQLSGSNITLSVNVGVYAGSEIEKRKLAQELFRSLQVAAGSKNKSVMDMI